MKIILNLKEIDLDYIRCYHSKTCSCKGIYKTLKKIQKQIIKQREENKNK
jgi:hypothetical protein